MSTDGPAATEVSATTPDWSREKKQFLEWSPEHSLIASIRAYQRATQRQGMLRWVATRWAIIQHRFWSAVSGADIPVTTRIAGGLLLPHPNGVVVHSDATIGPNCLLFQQVTLGVGRGGTPLLAGHVEVGASAKLLGPVQIGDHALIGANAVVLSDVPAGATAVGIPAKVRTSHGS